MFKVRNKDIRICKVNDNVNSKVTVAFVLISFLLTLNKFQFTEHIPLACSISKWVYIWEEGGEVERIYVWSLYSGC